MRYILLRGRFDERTQNSIDTDDDMWTQLVAGLAGEGDTCTIYYRGENAVNYQYKKNCVITTDHSAIVDGKDVVVFSRGGFQWLAEMLRDMPHAVKIRYGAGKRFMPEMDIDYNIVFVDNDRQRVEVIGAGCEASVCLIVKPAALHFKPAPVRKDFDVCYIANGEQAEMKNVEWVYKTVPPDLRVLHLGNKSVYQAPKNVTIRRVSRINMPTEISRCRVGIVPYAKRPENDSCPRVLSEILACGVPIIINTEMDYWKERYGNCMGVFNSSLICFWDVVKSVNGALNISPAIISGRFQSSFSMEVAIQHIKSAIGGVL